MQNLPMTKPRALAPLIGGMILAAVSLSPASAQNPFEFLLGRTSAPPQGSAPSRGSAPAKPAASAPAAAPSGMPATTMLPPKRPAALDEEPAATQSVVAQAPAKPSAPAPAAAGPLSEKDIVERANGYFNSITSLIGDFTQVGGDGRRLTGKLYLQRPGKIRFEYDPPATLEVIADGTSVAVRDRKLATQDLYTIGQTPLKFLLRERIDLGRDLKITEVAPENEAVRISLEDRSTFGGTSKITLYFDKDLANLTRWRIVDPQGFQTTVSLANLERNARVDQKLFVINYERILNDR